MIQAYAIPPRCRDTIAHVAGSALYMVWIVVGMGEFHLVHNARLMLEELDAFSCEKMCFQCMHVESPNRARGIRSVKNVWTVLAHETCFC